MFQSSITKKICIYLEKIGRKRECPIGHSLMLLDSVYEFKVQAFVAGTGNDTFYLAAVVEMNALMSSHDSGDLRGNAYVVVGDICDFNPISDGCLNDISYFVIFLAIRFECLSVGDTYSFFIVVAGNNDADGIVLGNVFVDVMDMRPRYVVDEKFAVYTFADITESSAGDNLGHVHRYPILGLDMIKDLHHISLTREDDVVIIGAGNLHPGFCVSAGT